MTWHGLAKDLGDSLECLGVGWSDGDGDFGRGRWCWLGSKLGVNCDGAVDGNLGEGSGCWFEGLPWHKLVGTLDAWLECLVGCRRM